MRDLSLDVYEQELRKSGIAPRHIRRTLLELADHADDLFNEALMSGKSEKQASQYAIRELGDPKQLAAAAGAQPGLRSWAYRFPQLALVVYPLIWVAVAPIVVGVQYAPTVARLCACFVLSALVTASMILILQLSITLT